MEKSLDGSSGGGTFCFSSLNCEERGLIDVVGSLLIVVVIVESGVRFQVSKIEGGEKREMTNL